MLAEDVIPGNGFSTGPSYSLTRPTILYQRQGCQWVRSPVYPCWKLLDFEGLGYGHKVL